MFYCVDSLIHFSSEEALEGCSGSVCALCLSLQSFLFIIKIVAQYSEGEFLRCKD